MTPEEFIDLVRDELDLPIETADLDVDLDQVVDWDSIMILRLVSAMERQTGRRVPISRVLADRSLRAIFDRIAAS